MSRRFCFAVTFVVCCVLVCSCNRSTPSTNATGEVKSNDAEHTAAKESGSAEVAIKAEMARLDGTWKTLKAEMNSKPSEKLIGQLTTIKGGRLYEGETSKAYKDCYRIEL